MIPLVLYRCIADTLALSIPVKAGVLLGTKPLRCIPMRKQRHPAPGAKLGSTALATTITKLYYIILYYIIIII